MSFGLALKTIFTHKASCESVMRQYAKTGEKALLVELYDACGNDLYHFVLTLSDKHLANDICQTTWLKVIEKKHLYKDSGKFKAWLFTLARNQLFDEFRRLKHIELPTDKLEDKHAVDITDIQGSLDFDQALMNLPFVQREAFCLQQESFTLSDIAKITHASTETVKSRLRYAKDNLRKQLKAWDN